MGARAVSRSGKMLVPLLGVLTVLAVISVGALAYVLRQEQAKRHETERRLQLAEAESDELKMRLEETQQAKSRTEEELSRARKELSQSKEELVKAAEAQETLKRSVEGREQEISRLTKEMEQLRAERQQLATQLSEVQQERKMLTTQLTDLEQAKGELETKVMELSEHPTVELEKVMVTSEPSAVGLDASGSGQALPVSASTASHGPEGQVVVINREYDFIVMNLGKNHGLSIGQEFQIVRGAEVLGRVKVEKVYDELSAAALLPQSKKDSIREGDVVKAL